jgi:hypothetical protein
MASLDKAPNKAHKLFATGAISRKELDSLLRADARFRFEETVTTSKSSSKSAEEPIPPDPVPSLQSSPLPPPARSAEAIQAHRDAARRRGRDEAKRAATAAEHEAQMASDRLAWEKILQDWDTHRRKPKVELLCARGIPPNMRQRAWSAMIGNKLKITRELYEITLERARTYFASTQQAAVSEREPAPARPSASREDSIQLIDQDIPRTFPGELAAVQRESETLREVLQTFCCFRPDVGYVQGMSFLVRKRPLVGRAVLSKSIVKCIFLFCFVSLVFFLGGGAFAVRRRWV